MDVSMYWGNSYIMTFEAHSRAEFLETVLGHLEKYWENLLTEDFSRAWRELQSKGRGNSGRFTFFDMTLDAGIGDV